MVNLTTGAKVGHWRLGYIFIGHEDRVAAEIMDPLILTRQWINQITIREIIIRIDNEK